MPTMQPAESAVNVAELIHRKALDHGDENAVVELSSGMDGDVRYLSYRELDQRASNIASTLRERSPAGSRVLVLQPGAIDFAVTFTGILYAGMVAVPAPLPGRYKQQQRRIRGIVEDADIRVILTNSGDLPTIQEWATEQALRDIEILDSDAVGSSSWTSPTSSPSALALLQYTSGSTGEPKGVMVTHANLVHNFRVLSDAMGFTSDTRYGCWLPMYHDMGLIGHLLPALFSGSVCVLMSSTSFLRRPIDWLRMIDEFRINHSAAPNFAYELCVRSVSDEQLLGLDLSSWTSAVNGSEPIMAQPLRQFVKRFSDAGFSEQAMAPSYGLAEATLFVSGANRRSPTITTVDTGELEHGVISPLESGRPGTELVSCGRAHGFDVRIVDPETHREVPAGRIGEIWLRGESVTLGYWENQNATAKDFGATLENGTQPYLRTGDLGFLLDNELYITGRSKEVLIVRGRNLYPQDIEYEVRLHVDELSGGFGAVFSVGRGETHLVLVHDIRGRHSEADLGEIARSVRFVVSREFGVRPAGVVLVRPGGVRRTTSGKIQRAAMRDLFLAKSLNPVYESLDESLATVIGRAED